MKTINISLADVMGVALATRVSITLLANYTVEGDTIKPGTTRYVSTDSSGVAQVTLSSGNYLVKVLDRKWTIAVSGTGTVDMVDLIGIDNGAAIQRGIPSGGTTGEILVKSSNTDYDADWVVNTAGSTAVWGGITGDITDQSDLKNELDTKADFGDIPNQKVITTVHLGNGVNTTLSDLTNFESATTTSDLGVLLFYQVTTTFSRWNEVKAFLDDGRTVVVNIEPMGTLGQINAGNFDQAFIDFKNYAENYALANPRFKKEQLLVKFMHEGNLSVGAYPWVVYDTPNLGVVYNKFTTPNATVQASIDQFKLGFDRLANLLGNQFLQRIFELGQDSWSGATQSLDLFFPNKNSYEIVSVNSYNRYGVSSGYGYWSAFGDNLRAWLESTARVCPEKPKMIGECATTAAGVVNPLGTVATITNGGSGFPASTTANIPSSAITHNGDIAPVLSYTTNSSGVITAVNLINKGEDITNISIASSFAGGTGANITVNLRQTGVSKPDWIREAFRFIRNNTDFKYFGWFLENKNVSPTDNRDWGLNTQRSILAFGKGWALLNDRVRIPSVGGKISPNICTDPYTNFTAGWDAQGSAVGVLSRTTLASNLPVNDRNVTGCIRLTQTSAGVTSGVPFNNRLRYAVPFWNGSGPWNGGIRENDIVTIEFDALFKPNNANIVNYTAPLYVVIEDTITSNYERGTTPQVMLTKQHRRYRVTTSNGQFSTGGWYISFLIGGISVPGEFIITNVNAFIGDGRTDLITKNSIGLGNVDNTSDLAKPISTAVQTVLDLKENLINPGTVNQYYRGDKTFQTLNQATVGLSNVDNTSDLNKPISTATQNALNLKQNIIKTPIARTSGGPQHFGLPGQFFNAVGTSVLSINQLRYVPLYIPYDIVVNNIQFEVTAGPASNANVRVGIYSANTDFQPNILVADFGSISVGSGFTGVRNLTVNQSLSAGWYLVAVNIDVAMSLRTIVSPSPLVFNTMGVGTNNPLIQRFEVGSTFGPMPTTPVAWTATNNSGGGIQNLILMQWQ